MENGVIIFFRSVLRKYLPSKSRNKQRTEGKARGHRLGVTGLVTGLCAHGAQGWQASYLALPISMPGAREQTGF